MNEIFAVSLASMQQDMGRVDRIALNLSNVTTPGYKREVVAVRPFVEALEAAGQVAVSGTPMGGHGEQVPGALEVLFDTRQGTLKMTGQPLDLALSGEGFFEVNTDQGPAYTRQGDFRVDARGRLVTAQGHPVMGKGGEIYLTTQTPIVDAAGNITEPNATAGESAMEPGRPVAQLRIVQFQSPRNLQHLGDGLVAPGTGMKVLSEGEAQVRQGALENANVSSAQEMVQLIQTMRHFESMQKVVQGYDDLLGTAIRKLGDMG